MVIKATLGLENFNFMNSNNIKIVVFVPETHTDILREAMGKAGAGKIGSCPVFYLQKNHPIKKWSGWQDLNLRPMRPKRIALPKN